MGNAVLDILVETSDSYLQKNNLLKGSMTLVEQEESDKIVNDIRQLKIPVVQLQIQWLEFPF